MKKNTNIKKRISYPLTAIALTTMLAAADYVNQPSYGSHPHLGDNNTDISDFDLQLSNPDFQACVLDEVQLTLPNAEATYYEADQRHRLYREFGPFLLIRDRGLSEIHSMAVSYDFDIAFERNDSEELKTTIELLVEPSIIATSRISNYIALPDVMTNFREIFNSQDRLYATSNLHEDGKMSQYGEAEGENKDDEFKETEKIHSRLMSAASNCIPQYNL